MAFIPWAKSTAGITDDSLDFGDTLEKRLTLPITVKLHATNGTLRCTTNFSNAAQWGSLSSPSFSVGDPDGDWICVDRS